jgi:hypothetical protein
MPSVARDGGAMIYVEDHGKPMAPTGLKGKLTVLNGAEKSEAELVVAGDKLEAKGIKLASGAKAVVSLVTPAAKAITVRFTVKQMLPLPAEDRFFRREFFVFREDDQCMTPE